MAKTIKNDVSKLGDFASVTHVQITKLFYAAKCRGQHSRSKTCALRVKRNVRVKKVD